MKIEIGESLVYSWLRHVKKCQVAQINWKPSPKWDRNNIDLLQRLEKEITQEFEIDPLDIFKKTSNIDQFLQQAEIDVVGIAQYGDKNTIYFVDVAFHEDGLNYGSKDETVARILKKYIRSYFIYRAFFCNFSNGEFYFISPKVSANMICTPLKDALGRLKGVFQRYGCAPDFQLIANDDFNENVLTPIMTLCNEIADTNELFLRSAQLCKMFKFESKQLGNKKIFTQSEVDPQTCDKPRPIPESNEEMNDAQLEQAIRSVGKTFFVEYYHLLHDLTKPNKNLVKLVREHCPYQETTANTKIANSRRIIKAHRAQEILEEIAQSQSRNLKEDVKAKARVLLQEFYP